MMRIFLFLLSILSINAFGQSSSLRNGWDTFSLKGKVKSVKTSHYYFNRDLSNSFRTMSLTFFENGRLESMQVNDGYKYVYSYDAGGDLVGQTEYNLIPEVDTMIVISQCNYHWEGNMRVAERWRRPSVYSQYTTGVKSSFKYSGEKKYDIRFTEFFDDTMQHIIRRITYDEKDSITGTELYKWENDRCVERKYFNDNGQYTTGTICNFDSFPKVVETRYHKGIESTRILNYDDNNNLVESYDVGDDGIPQNMNRYEYMYDDHGNWVSSAGYDSQDDFISTGSQEIEYFE